MAISVTVEHRARPVTAREQGLCPAATRAMVIWPRLDRRALARCGCDTVRIANYVARRTRMPARSIETLLNRS
jgi:hypothetical protein